MAASGGTARGPLPRRSAFAVDIGQRYPAVSVTRASWIVVVAICAIAVVLLALNGYTGYSIVVGAVGLSAAVNLIPERPPPPPPPG